MGGGGEGATGGRRGRGRGVGAVHGQGWGWGWHPAREVQLDGSEQPGAERCPAIPCGAAAGICWRRLHTGGKVGGLHAPSLCY